MFSNVKTFFYFYFSFLDIELKEKIGMKVRFKSEELE